MAERKATNKYYPPNWKPEDGSINKFVRKQKSQSNGGVGSKPKTPGKTVRFEIPFDAWCTNCNTFITKATRYNATKIRDGYYFSTPLFKFICTCTFCKCKMVVKNDPKNRTYEMVENIRMKEETYEFEKDDNAPTLLTEEEKEKLNDPFFRLEYGRDDEEKAEKELIPKLDDLKEIKDEHSKNDYEMNKLLKNKFRKERKKTLGDTLKFKQLPGLEIQKLNSEDVKNVDKIIFKSNSAVSKRNEIRNSSIFGTKKRTNQQLINKILKDKKK
eukprot:gene7243-11561_t